MENAYNIMREYNTSIGHIVLCKSPTRPVFHVFLNNGLVFYHFIHGSKSRVMPVLENLLKEGGLYENN